MNDSNYVPFPEPMFRTFVFRDENDQRVFHEMFGKDGLGPKAVGTDNKQTILISMIQEITSIWQQYAEEGNKSLDPVTRATHEASGWRCEVCGTTKNLQRHSHEARHSKAEGPEQCMTLCVECHRKHHSGERRVER